jgi:WD40 repeat protein
MKEPDTFWLGEGREREMTFAPFFLSLFWDLSSYAFRCLPFMYICIPHACSTYRGRKTASVTTGLGSFSVSWETNSGPLEMQPVLLTTLVSCLTLCSLSSMLFSASTDKTVAVWDSETGERVKRLKGHTSFVNSCYPARRGPQLVCTGSDDGTVKVGIVFLCLAVWGGIM